MRNAINGHAEFVVQAKMGKHATKPLFCKHVIGRIIAFKGMLGSSNFELL